MCHFPTEFYENWLSTICIIPPIKKQTNADENLTFLVEITTYNWTAVNLKWTVTD